jgi:plastocyanin
MTSKPFRGVILATACVLALLPASPASAATAAAGPGGFAAGFLTPVVVTAPGEAITFVSADVAPHNFIADGVYLPKKLAKKTKWCSAYAATMCPLFWSPTIGVGQTAEVEGEDFLKSGEQYPFYCSIHPGMKGTLVVR